MREIGRAARSLLLLAALSGPAVAGAKVLTGDLALIPGRGPVLKSGDQQYRLSGADDDVESLLRDPRMAGRRLHLEGQFKGSDGFTAERLYVLRGGQRYRAIYYCEVCNLTEFQPGDCVCCQKVLDLVEVPPDDARVIK